MKFELLGKEGAPSLMLIPGLGVSYEIFLPLVELLKDKFRITAVNSFDYKRVGFSGWFVILLLGICGIVLGILGLRNPDVTATTLSTLIGLGVIAMGISNLFALRGINRFEKAVDGVFKNNADEQ